MTITSKQLSTLLLIAGLMVLALDPVLWLVNSWIDPSYNSQGLYIAVIVLGLFIASYSSPPNSSPSNINNAVNFPRPKHTWILATAQKNALALLLLTSVIRLCGQLLGVHIISAMALVMDVYALAILAGLPHRKRPLSAAWLAALFAFSLPLENVVQRLLGFSLQQLSANGSCAVLSSLFESVVCHGVDILIRQKRVLVDLPCSGARGLLLILMLFHLIACIQRPGFRQGITGILFALVGAYIGNVIRICLLAIGIAFPQHIAGINVMDTPWHDIIGYGTLLIGSIPLLLWSRVLTQRETHCCASFKRAQEPSDHPQTLTTVVSTSHFINALSRWRALCLSVIFLSMAIIIVSLSPKPVDVVRNMQTPQLPVFLNGRYAQKQALTKLEKNYFTQYGGGASRALYGNFGLLLVSTSAPLRHLHAPKDCLSGAGHEVQYLGISTSPLAAAVYRSVDPSGNTWRVLATFISSAGEQTTNVSEAVWLWLKNPSTTWTMVQRITPWNDDLDSGNLYSDLDSDNYSDNYNDNYSDNRNSNNNIQQWDQALLQALDIPLLASQRSPIHSTTRSNSYFYWLDGVLL